MAWTDLVADVLKQYGGDASGGDADADFDRVAQHAPQGNMEQAILGALHSDSTPDIGSIVSKLFASAGGEQKADILNTLLTTVGPAIMQEVLRHLNLQDMAGMFASGPVSAAQAEQVPPAVAGRLAYHAHEQNPAVMSALSGFLSSNPALLKSLGGGALSAVMNQLAQ